MYFEPMGILGAHALCAAERKPAATEHSTQVTLSIYIHTVYMYCLFNIYILYMRIYLIASSCECSDVRLRKGQTESHCTPAGSDLMDFPLISTT